MTRKPSTTSAADLEWFKSSYSASDSNDCVEVAATPRAMRVRDSKDISGPQLGFGPGAWSAFVTYAARH